MRSEPVQSQNATMPEVKSLMLSSWDVVYAVNMAIACLITYWIMTHTLSRFVDVPSDFLGGMWAVAATVFVFRGPRRMTLSRCDRRLTSDSCLISSKIGDRTLHRFV